MVSSQTNARFKKPTPKALTWCKKALPRYLLAGLIVLGLTATTTIAQADTAAIKELPVTVLGVKTENAFDQAEALTQGVRKAVRDAVGWSLTADNRPLELFTIPLKCPSPIDAACEQRIADAAKVDRFIWASIKLEGPSVVGHINFYVRGKPSNRVPLSYSANLTEATDDALVKVARDAVAEVTGGPPKGDVKVNTGGVAGQLYVNDTLYGNIAPPNNIVRLSSGKHRLVVKAQGYSDAEATIDVKPASVSEVMLDMIAIDQGGGVDGRMIGGFAGIGVGLTAGIVGIWAALEVNSIRNDEGFAVYREGFTADQNACDQARDGVTSSALGASDPATVADMCDEASSLEVVQAVMFPVAGVAVGVGIWLLATSDLFGSDEPEDDATKTGWSVQPSVGPNLQHLQLTYTF